MNQLLKLMEKTKKTYIRSDNAISFTFGQQNKKKVSSSLEPSSTETLIKIISLNDEQNDLKVV